MPTDAMDQYYTSLLNGMKVSVSKHLMDDHYTVLWASDYYYDLIGYPKLEYEALFHNQCDRYFTQNPVVWEMIVGKVMKALEMGDNGYTAFAPMRRKDGSIFWAKLVATFTDEWRDGYRIAYTMMTDVSDMRQMQSEQTATYNTIPGFIVKFRVSPSALTIVDANRKFIDFFGLDQKSLDMDYMLDHLTEESRRLIMDAIPGMLNGEPIHFILQAKDSDGAAAWFQVAGERIEGFNSGDDEPLYLSIFTDITETQRMKEELEQQRSQLGEALRDAQFANQAKSDFLSRMSHDIRTPMNAIMGMTEIADTHLDEPARVHDCLRKISISTQHLLGLINDVLDMSKIESGKMSLNIDSMFLPEFTENVIAMVLPMSKAKNQQFTVRLHALVHEHYLCDSLRLRQCFLNILSNAVKFTPEGGRITLDMEEETDTEERSFLTFVFSDTGIGIKEEFIATLFDAFSRERDSRVDKTEGSGLGMAITKKIVDLMGGTVTVRSKPNEGTVFTVRLPLRIDEAARIPVKLPPLSILVVDDDSIMGEYSTQVLTECGASVQWVDNGASAINCIVAAHNSNRDYDAVIMDWKMPELDGLETIERIRAAVGSKLPIMIASAYDWSEIEESAKRVGVDGLLKKPLFRSPLCRAIRKYVLRQDDAELAEDLRPDYDFSGRHILLIEDNELNQEIAVELLTEVGAQMDCAENGAEGVRKFSSSPENCYDLILMDLQMPVMDGYEATKVIRRLDRGDATTIPIFAMTADAFAEDVAATKTVGMNGHLIKPLDVDVMKREISRLFGQA